jgi:archaellum component FlaC
MSQDHNVDSPAIEPCYIYGHTGGLEEWRRRFVSESELHESIGRFTKSKAEAQKRLSEIDTKLDALGERLERLGRALRDVKQSVSKDILRELLRFGPESGVTADGVIEFLNERNRLEITIRDCETRLSNLGV